MTGFGPAQLDRRTFLNGAFTTGALIASAACACSCLGARAHTAHASEGAAGDAAPASTSASSQGQEQGQGAPFDPGTTAEPKPATEHTARANEGVYALLDFSDTSELVCAQKGLIAAPEALEIVDDDGRVIWSQRSYEFLDTPAEDAAEDAQADASAGQDATDPAVDVPAPASANPSLWRHTRLNHITGLFEVVEGIYQVRGYDMSNITFVRGQTGWIVFDPLMSVECAQAAFDLVRSELEDLPVVGVVLSHTHVDHYGGIKGIVSEEEVAERAIPIIAPDGFVREAVSENVYAGPAMSRRATYQYGTYLTPGERGSLAIGIGMGQSRGTTSFIAPNDLICETGEVRTVDGVEMEFQLTPGTEAPAEMNTWFPGLSALWMAENCTGTLHNLYTLRGAQVRDGAAWATYLMEAKARYGGAARVVFQAHNWPHWDEDPTTGETGRIATYLENTAAAYKYINDQTLRYLNQGYTSTEIARMIELPDELARVWYTRQYYGTVAHNARAVYQRFMGFYDANPVNLFPLDPQAGAKKLVEYLGDVDAVLEHARADFEAGEYQWVAQITNALVFANPGNQAARLLCADALEQLGYQAESGTWRNVYLSGALELREGVQTSEAGRARQTSDLTRAMAVDQILDYLGILIDASQDSSLSLTVNLNVTDDEPYVLEVRSGVVLYQRGVQDPNADATLTATRLGLLTLVRTDLDAMRSAIEVSGDPDVLDKLAANRVTFDRNFAIVEP